MTGLLIRIGRVNFSRVGNIRREKVLAAVENSEKRAAKVQRPQKKSSENRKTPISTI